MSEEFRAVDPTKTRRATGRPLSSRRTREWYENGARLTSRR